MPEGSCMMNFQVICHHWYLYVAGLAAGAIIEIHLLLGLAAGAVIEIHLLLGLAAGSVGKRSWQ